MFTLVDEPDNTLILWWFPGFIFSSLNLDLPKHHALDQFLAWWFKPALVPPTPSTRCSLDEPVRDEVWKLLTRPTPSSRSVSCSVVKTAGERPGGCEFKSHECWDPFICTWTGFVLTRGICQTNKTSICCNNRPLFPKIRKAFFLFCCKLRKNQRARSRQSEPPYSLASLLISFHINYTPLCNPLQRIAQWKC